MQPVQPPPPPPLTMAAHDSYFALPVQRPPPRRHSRDRGLGQSSGPSSDPKALLSSSLERIESRLSDTHRPQPASNKLYVCSLASFVDCFHPTTGRLRVGSDKWNEPEYLPIIEQYGTFSEQELLAGEVLADSVEHLILDLRFVVGEDEWGKNAEFGAVQGETTTTTWSRKRQTVSQNPIPLSLPHLYKITFVGSEYVEVYSTRARMVAEIVESCGQHVLDVEWVTSADHQSDALLCTATHLVHPLVIEAGNRIWGPEAIENGTREGGLRKLTVQGGFPIRNSGPAPPTGEYKRIKTDYSFAFKDWIPVNGVANLCWSFQGSYSQACIFTILKHLFNYISSQFISPCAILILQHLAPPVLETLSIPTEKTLARLGLADNPKLLHLLEDIVHVESQSVAANSLLCEPPRVVTRLWSTGYEEPEDGDDEDRQRGIRRFKSDILANEHGDRASMQALMASGNLLPPPAFSPPVLASRPLSRQSSFGLDSNLTTALQHAASPRMVSSPSKIQADSLQVSGHKLPSLSNSPSSLHVHLASGDSSSSLDTVSDDISSEAKVDDHDGTIRISPLTPSEEKQTPPSVLGGHMAALSFHATKELAPINYNNQA